MNEQSVPLKRLHLLIVGCCAIGFAFDLGEIALNGVLSTVFSAAPYNVSSALLSWVLTSVYIGAVIGAPAFGWLADRVGRVAALKTALIVIALASFGAAASSNIEMLGVFRLIAGFALGGFPPILIAYLTEILPASRRGPLTMISVALAYLGPIFIIFATRQLMEIEPLGIEGWRWGFVVGGLGALFAAGLFAKLPETQDWLKSRNREDEASIVDARFARSRECDIPLLSKLNKGTAPATGGLSGKAVYGPLIALALVFFFIPWAANGFSMLSGAVMVSKGYDVSHSLLYLGLSTFGPVIGTIASAFVFDRVSRRLVLISLALVMIVLGFAFAQVTGEVSLVLISVVYMLAISVYLPALTIYGSEQFAPKIRARMNAALWAVNRLGSIFVPISLLPVLHGHGSMAMFGVIAGTLMMTIIVLIVFAPERALFRRTARQA